MMPRPDSPCSCTLNLGELRRGLLPPRQTVTSPPSERIGTDDSTGYWGVMVTIKMGPMRRTEHSPPAALLALDEAVMPELETPSPPA